MDIKVWKAIAIFAIFGLVLISLVSFFLIISQLNISNFGGSCIGVVRIDGPIMLRGMSGGLFDRGMPGAEDYARQIELLSKNNNVKGLLVIINSPGGGVIASDVIYRAIKKSKLPKWVYIEELGASGGYYVALAGEKIYAHPNSLVGNIGVVMYIENYAGLLEKIGVNFTVVKSGSMKDIGNPTRNLTEEEYQVLKSIVEETFEDFVSILQESRQLNDTSLEIVKTGRIFTGKQAYKIGLLDGVYTKSEIIEEFKKTLNVDRICDYTPQYKQEFTLMSLFNIERLFNDRISLRAE